LSFPKFKVTLPHVGQERGVTGRKFVPLIFAVVVFNPSLWAKRPPKMNNVTTVRMERPTHDMVAINCRINRAGRWYLCVIDTGATYTVVADRVLKAEGPLVDLTTANGVVRVRQREVSLTIADGLELKSRAFVQSNMLQDVDILIGQDVLRQFRSVIFDYQKQQIEFHR
jgi:predicted aspartyl protease